MEGWGGPGAGGGLGQPGPRPHLRPSAWLVSRELLNAHKDNLGTTIKFVIFNELSNARNPNNMQILYTVLQHSAELAPKVGRRLCGHVPQPGTPHCWVGESAGLISEPGVKPKPRRGAQWVGERSEGWRLCPGHWEHLSL